MSDTTAATRIIRPVTADDVAAALKLASDTRQSVLIRGAGTKIDWGRMPGAIDVVLDMAGLNNLVAHQHGDLTATIEAGAALREVNDALARHGQWLPLDPPFADRATIGGILATNDSGPLRHRFGTPRDLVIGVRLATTDGVLSKAGGQVVKNVAGYDLSKLVTGSFGSLAAIVSATFKLSPVPAASKTMCIELPDAAALTLLVRDVMASQLEPIAFELIRQAAPTSPGSHISVLLRFASLPAVVDAQIDRARAGLKCYATSSTLLDGDAERSRWREHGARAWDGTGTIVRASWLPADIEAVVATLAALPAPATLTGRAAVGAGLVRIEGDDEQQARAIEQLRQSRHVGNVVVVRASAALKGLVDVWGSMGDRQPLFASLKRALDPNNVLNAQRGPL